MMGNHHMIFAASGWVAGYSTGIIPQTTAGGVLPGLAVATVCGLLPDIDEDGSIVSRSLGPVGQAISYVVSAISGGHRGATHTVPAALVVATVVWALTKDPGLAAAALWGYVSHLIGDTLTPWGVPWSWPLRPVDDRVSLNLFTTGTYLEVVVVWGWVAACAVAVYRART